MSSNGSRPLKRAVIREEFVAITGSYQEALVLGQMDYWAQRCHDIDAYLREENLRRANEGQPPGTEPTEGWFWKSADELAEELMTGWTRGTVRGYLASLVKKGFIEQRHNPNYKWDRTIQYRYCLGAVAAAMAEKGYSLQHWQMPPCSEAAHPCSESDDQRGETATAIPEIITETTVEATTEARVEGTTSKETATAPNGAGSPTLTNADRARLEATFCTITGIDPPLRQTEKQRRQAASLWWEPLRRLAALVGGDVDKATELMTEAWQRLDGEVTVSSPKSLYNTAVAIAGEWRRNGHPRQPVVTF